MTNIKKNIKINKAFYIYCQKFQQLSDKALDYLISSWKMKGEDREIALLYQKKYNRMAMKYLERANEALNEK